MTIWRQKLMDKLYENSEGMEEYTELKSQLALLGSCKLTLKTCSPKLKDAVLYVRGERTSNLEK